MSYHKRPTYLAHFGWLSVLRSRRTIKYDSFTALNIQPNCTQIRRPLANRKQQGFTLVELVVTITLTLIISTTFYTYFKSSFIGYLNLQKDASGLTDLAQQSQRIASVVRGATDITSVAANDLVMYGYFYPTDAYVSIVHYYLNGTGTILYADVTPMTANPPIGTPITAKKKTYKIIESFKQTPGLSLFNYLDSGGGVLGLPIIDQHSIKGVRVNLAVQTATSGNEAVNVDVSLRNRKYNL